MICGTVGYDFSIGAFAVLMISPISFAIGNLLLRQARDVPMFDLIAWLCLVPPLPLFALALLTDGPQATLNALIHMSLTGFACMLALGYVTRYSGTDAALGLAFAQTGVLYPMFGTLLGWLGVALTGSDTASNVLFGGLQKITAQQLGLNPVLMAAANSSGGVMGKMIDAQSIVVASTATRWYGHEGEILRFVFFHSIALAILVGVLVTIQAYM